MEQKGLVKQSVSYGVVRRLVYALRDECEKDRQTILTQHTVCHNDYDDYLG